ncbi:glutamine-dependent NAD(+) synthetase [Oxobacter pfennigii]|uniref:Glutamine-dependent NAD(+) synthetase n=1 Tax=Oxobacter pfennigii TaxID=36849 RepID=A0A0P8W964_9CLOT|nr:NAD(+) synthase [Oxobacter pfennigii]KPU44242.1 glutamine-dependent NAD(+) synthetase [Oxobacter pfennigii]
MVNRYGFVRVGAAAPKLKVADPVYNIKEIENLILKAEDENAAVITFPELSISAYTCGDLFGQESLLKACDEAVKELCTFSAGRDIVIVVGAPVSFMQFTFNCAVVIQRGKILGVVPKMYIPNYSEFYERRWFSPANTYKADEIIYCNEKVPFGRDILFQSESFEELTIGIEVCEDLWSAIPPSSYQALSGATLLLNVSASNELVNKAAYRADLVKQQSARLIAAYVYSASGVHESTTDLVFSGHSIIAENGVILEQAERFERESSLIVTEIDLLRLNSERRKNLTFRDSEEISSKNFRRITFKQKKAELKELKRMVNPHPFVPSDVESRNERCREIFNIQVAGLAKRIEHTGSTKAVIGISGGLDSTLALLVTLKTFNILNMPAENIHTITMPGFGTTDRTYNNTIKLCRALNTNFKEVSIVEASLLHFKDIGHDPEILDVTYENVQARERTQILMDTANKIGGLVVGTGDLSELALGWATYNGDHMSMYGVNASVPKTLVRYLVRWVAEKEMDKDTAAILFDILDTPVSPELLPADKSGQISQKTEDIVGPYELHDFFLYHMMKYGATPKKIAYLANNAFKQSYSTDEIKKWIKVFYRRFFSQQFKRSCLPDGPKVGTISLSPRGDWRMPSDASANIWLEEIDNIK